MTSDGFFTVETAETYRSVDIAFDALAISFAAFCVWLGVRIFNRRERWAKRTAAGLGFGLPVLYVASFGPACWLVAQPIRDGMTSTAPAAVYWPLGRFAHGSKSAIGLRLRWWIMAGVPKGWAIVVPTGPNELHAYFAN